jgi:hypothetical protein
MSSTLRLGATMAKKTLFNKKSATNALEENELDQHSSKVSTACTIDD